MKKSFTLVSLAFLIFLSNILSVLVMPLTANAEVQTVPSFVSSNDELEVYNTDLACENIKSPSKEYQGTWKLKGMATIEDSTSGETIGKTHNYVNQLGEVSPMISPMNLEDWVSSLTDDSEQALQKIQESDLETLYLKPNSSKKEGFCRVAMLDVMDILNLDYTFAATDSLLEVETKHAPKVTHFTLSKGAGNVCVPIGEEITLTVQMQVYGENPRNEKLKVDFVYYDTETKKSFIYKRINDVKVESNGYATTSTKFKVDQFENIEMYVRVTDSEGRYDEDTTTINAQVGSIKPLGKHVSVCGEYEGTIDEQPIQMYNYDNDETLYESRSLEREGYLIRNNGRLNQYPTNNRIWHGILRYPTIYYGHKDQNGYLKDVNKTMTKPIDYKKANWNILAYDYGFIHLLGPVDSQKKINLDDTPHNKIATTGYNVTLIQNMTPEHIKNIFNGNPNYVLAQTERHNIIRMGDYVDVGTYYYIRDLAESAGAEVDNYNANENKTSMQVYQTDKPDITSFKITEKNNVDTGKSCAVGEEINFEFTGYEYVANTIEDKVRNTVKWSLEVVSEQGDSNKLEGTLKSDKTKNNSSKKAMDRYSGEFKKNNLKLTFDKEGKYSLNLYVEDEVMRVNTKTLTFEVGKDDCNEEITPEDEIPPLPDCKEMNLCPDSEEDNPPEKCEDIEGANCNEEVPTVETCKGANCGSTPVTPVSPPFFSYQNVCPNPQLPAESLKPFKYEMDWIVTKIEGKTVPQNTLTDTPVTIARGDFSADREALKSKIQGSISMHEGMLADCNAIIEEIKEEIKQVELQITATQQALSQCLADVEETGADCSGYTETLQQLNAYLVELKEKLAKAETTKGDIIAAISYLKGYLATIISQESKYKTLSTTLALYVNGSITETPRQVKSVTLNEGETDIINFTWKLEKDSLITGFIDHKDEYKLCSSEVTPCETTNDNNQKSTPVYISSYETMNACVLDGNKSKMQGIVRTINTTNNPNAFTPVYEELYATLEINEHEKQRRAGYGFHYTLFTEYRNYDVANDRSEIGVTEKRGKSYKPDILTSYLDYPYKKWTFKTSESTQMNEANSLKLEGYRVDLEQTEDETIKSGAFFQNKEFELPIYSVEKYSGNVFEGTISKANNHSQHDFNDTLLDGGRKWYIDFYQPYGEFSFNTIVQEIGVNKLTPCLNGIVEVAGKPIGDKDGDNDFVYRFVDANTPFPQGTGWNWSLTVDTITDIKDWFLRAMGGNGETDYEEHYHIINK